MSSESSGGITEEDVSKWYQALYEEDCLAVMKLLEDHPTFLKRGWEREPERKVRGSQRNYWVPPTETPWMGRTALHVGARRGCVQLVKQVLRLCGVRKEEEPVSPGAVVQSGGPEIEELGTSGVGHPAPPIGEEDTAAASSARIMDAAQIKRAEMLRRGFHPSVFAEKFLSAKDGVYELDALAMLVVNGNYELIDVLVEGIYDIPGACERCSISKDDVDSVILRRRASEATTEPVGIREKLRMVITEYASEHSEAARCLRRLYRKNLDFNFLPEEYLVHFLFTDFGNYEVEEGEEPLDQFHFLRYIFDKVEMERSFLSFVLSLPDGQGRPPLHVGADEGTLNEFWTRTINRRVAQKSLRDIEMMGIADAEGRRRAEDRMRIAEDEVRQMDMAMMGRTDGRQMTVFERILIRGDTKVVVNWFDWVATENAEDDVIQALSKLLVGSCFKNQQKSLALAMAMAINLDSLSRQNGFKGVTWTPDGGCSTPPRHNNYQDDRQIDPMCRAIVHNRAAVLQELWETVKPNLYLDSMGRAPQSEHDGTDAAVIRVFFRRLFCDAKWTCILWCEKLGLRQSNSVELKSLEFAALVGDEQMAKCISNVSSKLEPSHCIKAPNKRKETWKAIQHATSQGKYDLLRSLIDQGLLDGTFDPFMEDDNGDTLLHHVTKWSTIEFDFHLLDYVSCQHILDTKQHRVKYCEERSDRKIVKSKRFVVERQGCTNQLVQLGLDIHKTNNSGQLPHPGPDMDAEFLSWWYDMQVKEFERLQRTYIGVLNATSVVAALVATASYVGPLQPPLGYDTDGSGLQLQHLWARAFIVCDTMSFYLAIAAIICTFIPSLPIPQRPMRLELQRTQRIVILAIVVLVPSIMFVLLAFAASSIVVIQNHPHSWNHGGLTIGTAAIGGLVCLFFILLFIIRLVGFVFSKKYALARRFTPFY